jgi:hypothetical protein
MTTRAWPGDQAAHVLDVGHPATVGVGAIKHRATRRSWPTRPAQWISWNRDQHFVAGPGERAQRQLNPSDVPDVMIHPIGETGMPRRSHSAATLRGPRGCRRTARNHFAREWPDRPRQSGAKAFEAERNGVADIKVVDASTGSL